MFILLEEYKAIIAWDTQILFVYTHTHVHGHFIYFVFRLAVTDLDYFVCDICAGGDERDGNPGQMCWYLRPRTIQQHMDRHDIKVRPERLR